MPDSVAARLSYENHVPPDATTQTPTIVLLGSLGSDRSMWAQQIRELSRDFRVVAVDHRGHGASEVLPGPYSMDDLTGDVLALLDSLGVTRAHVVGLSLGGAVAQWLAIHHPGRVESLALLCTAARFGEPDAWLERAATVRGGGVAAVAEAVVARWITRGLATRDSGLEAQLTEMVLATPAEGYSACCEALAGYDVRADLGRIRCPTLAVAGDEDPSTPPEVVREIADGIGGARFEILSPAAHVPTFELPEAVTELLRSHVDSAARAAVENAGDENK